MKPGAPDRGSLLYSRCEPGHAIGITLEGMADTLADLGDRFRFNTAFLRRLTRGFEPEHWSCTLSESGGNSAHWILGHIAASRRATVRFLGGELEPAPWESIFTGALTVAGVAGAYPEAEFLARNLQAAGKQLGSILREMGPEQQAQPWEGEPFPDGSDTLGGVAHFMHFHESYHLGQIGMIRTSCGLERVI